MSTQVCKAFFLKPAEAWFALSAPEQAAFLSKNDASIRGAGGHSLIICDSSWSSERWPLWGAEVFPSIDAERQHTAAEQELNWFRYVRSITLLGTPQGEIVVHTPAPGEVFKLWMAKPGEAWHRLARTEQDALLAKGDAALKQAGGQRLLVCDSAWVSERWLLWGVEVFPGVAAVQEHARLMGQLNWLRYLDSFTLIGTHWQG